MKNRSSTFLLLALSALIHGHLTAQQLAFPGAEGYAAYVTGGRGGVVYEVTNLSDDVANPPVGSLRYALTDTSSRSPRTIVFRVSGIIVLQGRLDVGRNGINNVTIAGQTAPGDGICLRKYPMKVYGTNIIIRYLRFRPGDESGSNSPAIYGIDVENARYVMVDHCSFSWSIEETATFYDNKYTTLQWSIISESLNSSANVKGDHGYAGVWGGQYASYHHNLIAHHHSRTPRFNGSRSHDTTAIVDYRNNVIYNWGNSDATYGGEVLITNSISWINMVGNYYRAGPATPTGTKSYRIIEPTDTATNISRLSKWYVAGNYVYGYPAVTTDNWNGGVQPKPSNLWPLGAYRSDSAFTVAPVVTQTAQEAYTAVLAGAGATLPRRDSLDLRILREVSTGTATYGATSLATGYYGPGKGIINSQTDVGGWPVYRSDPAPADTDHDGIPDVWELAHGLNPNDPSDGATIASDGYSNLEHYVNSLVSSAVTSVRGTVAEVPVHYALAQNYPNPVNPSTSIRFELPVSGFVSLAVFDLLGRRIETLVEGIQEAGTHTRQWNANGLSSGIYIYRLEAGGTELSRKLVVLK